MKYFLDNWYDHLNLLFQKSTFFFSALCNVEEVLLFTMDLGLKTDFSGWNWIFWFKNRMKKLDSVHINIDNQNLWVILKKVAAKKIREKLKKFCSKFNILTQNHKLDEKGPHPFTVLHDTFGNCLHLEIFTFAHLHKENRPVHMERKGMEFKWRSSLALLAILYVTSYHKKVTTSAKILLRCKNFTPVQKFYTPDKQYLSLKMVKMCVKFKNFIRSTVLV